MEWSRKEWVEKPIKIGIIGDFDQHKASHPATNEAIRHAASRLSIKADIAWMPTPSLLTSKGQKSLRLFDCLWASSGSPYESNDGMLKGIQIARKLDVPFMGT